MTLFAVPELPSKIMEPLVNGDLEYRNPYFLISKGILVFVTVLEPGDVAIMWAR
jgi:hypothetical protein